MKLFWLSMVLLTLNARADVLFFDVNNASKEIEAAKRAAAKTGEKLWIIPDRKAGQTLISNENLSQELAKLKAKGAKLTSMVISGHDGNGRFFSENDESEFNESDLKEAFEKNAPLGAGIRSVFLWGCYAANPKGAYVTWRNVVPNLEMVVGFNELAPLSIRASSYNYLEDALSNEKNLLAMNDGRALQSAFKKLRGVNDTSSAICVRHNYITPNKVRTYNQLLDECKPYERLKVLSEKTNCYIKALAGCTEVPNDTRSGAIRLLYNEVQSKSHCGIVDTSFEPDADALLRLIYYKNVMSNFLDGFSEELASFNALGLNLGIPNELLLDKLAGKNRKEVVDALNALASYLQKNKSKMNKTYFNQFEKALGIIRSTIGELNSDYVLSSWLEAKSDTISYWLAEDFNDAMNSK